MKKIKEIFNVLYALGVLALLCYIIYMFIKYTGILVISGVEKISNITSNMDSVVIVALITGSISIVTVLISSIIAKRIEYKQNIQKYLYGKREEPYKKFIGMIYKIQKNTKSGNYDQDEILDDMYNFSEGLTLWGSSKVIKKWIKYREKSQNPDTAMDNLFLLEDIIFEIRKDMGQKEKLKKGDILSFIVNDVKKYLNPKNKQS